MNDVQTVTEIFAGKLMQIPDYQRGYPWDEQDSNDFLDDLELLDPGKISAPIPSFLTTKTSGSKTKREASTGSVGAAAKAGLHL